MSHIPYLTGNLFKTELEYEPDSFTNYYWSLVSWLNRVDTNGLIWNISNHDFNLNGNQTERESNRNSHYVHTAMIQSYLFLVHGWFDHS